MIIAQLGCIYDFTKVLYAKCLHLRLSSEATGILTSKNDRDFVGVEHLANFKRA